MSADDVSGGADEPASALERAVSSFEHINALNALPPTGDFFQDLSIVLNRDELRARLEDYEKSVAYREDVARRLEAPKTVSWKEGDAVRLQDLVSAMTIGGRGPKPTDEAAVEAIRRREENMAAAAADIPSATTTTLPDASADAASVSTSSAATENVPRPPLRYHIDYADVPDLGPESEEQAARRIYEDIKRERQRDSSARTGPSHVQCAMM